jgi:hypothetical protein
MIQLATDPTASRTGFRPAQSAEETRQPTLETRPGRTGHAWPFPSRYAARPGSQEGWPRTGTSSESGS